jgi:hypothetical protein
LPKTQLQLPILFLVVVLLVGTVVGWSFTPRFTPVLLALLPLLIMSAGNFFQLLPYSGAGVSAA